MKVFVENVNSLIMKMFEANGWEVVRNPIGVDLVCFEGGADVSPILYGEQNRGASFCDQETDWSSLVLYNNAKRQDIPMVGICRGGQFLNVMAGGKMKQHHDGHAISGTHRITVGQIKHYFGDEDDATLQESAYQVTSTHHQVMLPNEDNQEVIGWADDQVIEIVSNWKECTLSFQPHPEYVDKGHECQTLFFNLLDEILFLRA